MCAVCKLCLLKKKKNIYIYIYILIPYLICKWNRNRLIMLGEGPSRIIDHSNAIDHTHQVMGAWGSRHGNSADGEELGGRRGCG